MPNHTDAATVPPPTLTMRRIAGTWWPLAASWFLMGMELPLVSAVLARLSSPEISLAAYGGIVFPLSLLIEAPIIMLLAASTALSKDWRSYVKLRRFMIWAGAGLTLVHIAVTFTPLYYVVVRGILGVPSEIVEPGRLGLMILTPWTWAIAYRRFQQGVLIRFGHSRAVGVGTLVRLACNCAVLAIGYFFTQAPGIVVGASGVCAGVVCEAIFVGLWVRPVLKKRLRPAPPVAEPITLRGFLHFYVPLALTSTIGLMSLPIICMALSRMPRALESLAVWPVLGGLVFLMRALGFAYNEVVVALVDEPRSLRRLKRFTNLLSVSNTMVLLLLAATPLSDLWFVRVSALTPALAVLANNGIWIFVLMPGLCVWQNWFQGIIVNGRQTRGIPEAMLLAIATSAGLLIAGVWYGRITGLYVGLTAAVTANFMQVIWLHFRSRPAMRALELRDGLREAEVMAAPVVASGGDTQG